MPVTDPIADLLTRMRNAQHARRTECRCPWSRHKQQLSAILRREGYLREVRVEGEGDRRELVMTFVPDRPPLVLQRVSKPGRRMYQPMKGLRPVLSGMGISVVSTSAGLLTDREAREKGVGGEVLCTVS